MSPEQRGVSKPSIEQVVKSLGEQFTKGDQMQAGDLLPIVYQIAELGYGKHPKTAPLLSKLVETRGEVIRHGLADAFGQVVNAENVSEKERVRLLRNNVRALRMLGMDTDPNAVSVIEWLAEYYPEAVIEPGLGKRLKGKLGQVFAGATAPATVEPAPYLTPGEVLIDPNQAKWIKIGEGFTGEVSELPALSSVGNKIVVENGSLAAIGVVLPKKVDGRQSEDRAGVTVLKDGTMVFFGADGVSTGYKSGDFAAQFIINLAQAEVEATGQDGLDQIFADPEDFCIKLSNKMRSHHQDAIVDLEGSRKENPAFIDEHNYNSNKALLDKHGCGTTFFMLAVAPNGSARYLSVGDGLLEHIDRNGSVKRHVSTKEGPNRNILHNGFSTLRGLYGTYDRRNFQLEESEMLLFGTDGLVYGRTDEIGEQTLARVKKAFKDGRQVGELGQEGDDLTVFAVYRKHLEARKPAAPAATKAPETRKPQAINKAELLQRLEGTELTAEGFAAAFKDIESITDEEDPTGDLRAKGMALLGLRKLQCESNEVIEAVGKLDGETFDRIVVKMPVPLAWEFNGRYSAYRDIKRANEEGLDESLGYLRSLVSDAYESYKSDYRSAMQEYVDSPEYTVNPNCYYAGRLVVLRERYAEVAALYITQIVKEGPSWSPEALVALVVEAPTPGLVDNLKVETEEGKQVVLEIYKSTFRFLDDVSEGSAEYNNALEWQKALEARLPELAQMGEAIRYSALLIDLRQKTAGLTYKTAGLTDGETEEYIVKISKITDDPAGYKRLHARACLDEHRYADRFFYGSSKSVSELARSLKMDKNMAEGICNAYLDVEAGEDQIAEGKTREAVLQELGEQAQRVRSSHSPNMYLRGYLSAINGYRKMNGADDEIPLLSPGEEIRNSLVRARRKIGI